MRDQVLDGIDNVATDAERRESRDRKEMVPPHPVNEELDETNVRLYLHLWRPLGIRDLQRQIPLEMP